MVGRGTSKFPKYYLQKNDKGVSQVQTDVMIQNMKF